ncbi:hypothetical protein [Lentibacillus jeotgali]|uniref:hypothetical protein n=1 Tax=Lentibacillus jeotgali TaxID=558169 RepID=UPI000262601C|nr:hypothetical protein [Lentibacillus jeotgali]
MNAFTPLIDLLQSLAYPVSLFVVIGGAIFVMIGNKEKGFNAALGYMLVVIALIILDVLVDALGSVVS